MNNPATSAHALPGALANAAVILGRKAAEIDAPAALLEGRLQGLPASAARDRGRIEELLTSIRQYQGYLGSVAERLHLEAARCVSPTSAPIDIQHLHAFCLSVCDQIQAHMGFCQEQLALWSPPEPPTTRPR